MKKIEKISNIIHERILSNFYTRMVDWFSVSELEGENESYLIKFYINFIIDDENGLDEFKYDIEKIVEEIENNVIIKIENEIFVTTIKKVNLKESSVEIILISEKVNN